MADDAQDAGDPGDRTDEAALSARLRRLDKQLGRNPASQKSETGAPPTSAGSGLARGLRLSSELVAGVVVGVILGWALDHWVGTSPWGLIVFVLLGFVAGVRNVIRAAAMENTSGSRG